jgi:catechol 2,3-dioxygenase-like lactoylglutathione lyase family enzyme
MITGGVLDHVAVAAERQQDLWPRYAGDLAGTWLAGDDEDDYEVGFRAGQVAFANGTKVELLEPFAVEVNDFLRRFLDRSGPGTHHLTFKVPDLAAALAEVEAAGILPVGVNLEHEGWKEAFLHPKQARGVVVQLAQSSGEWSSPAPAGMPAPRTAEAARLDFVAHAVASLDDGLALFAGVLGGEESAAGKDDDARWIELAWPGPGRVRLLEPLSDASPVARWLGELSGRVHHLAFTCDDPGGVPGALQRAGGVWEVPPDANLGVRLVLRPPA